MLVDPFGFLPDWIVNRLFSILEFISFQFEMDSISLQVLNPEFTVECIQIELRKKFVLQSLKEGTEFFAVDEFFWFVIFEDLWTLITLAAAE